LAEAWFEQLELGVPKKIRPLIDVPILVVEDHPASGRLFAAVLTAAGAVVHTVSSASAAVAVLGELRPRVILVDIFLADSNGLALVKMLKADVRTRSIVCIAITVLNGIDLERAALDAGCAALVRKPIDVESLPTLIKSHL
jgi:CheY-like chemotaxis protein